MGELADRLNSIHISVSTAGGNIVGTIYGRTERQLWIAPDAYRRYNEPELEQHLENLLRRLTVAWMRQYHTIRSEVFGRTVTGAPPSENPRDQEFYRRRDELLASGRSSNGRIIVELQGLRDWRVLIADHTLRLLTPEEFSQQFCEAALAAEQNQRRQIRELKYRIYDPKGSRFDSSFS